MLSNVVGISEGAQEMLIDFLVVDSGLTLPKRLQIFR